MGQCQVIHYGETIVRRPLRNLLPVDRRAPLRLAMAGCNPNAGQKRIERRSPAWFMGLSHSNRHPFKAHWGKINFIDCPFLTERYQFDRFKPFICPMFPNRYLAQRLLKAA